MVTSIRDTIEDNSDKVMAILSDSLAAGTPLEKAQLGRAAQLLVNAGILMILMRPM